jgi:hypothetical protein
MKFFFIAFTILTLVSAFFWATDAPGSGLQYPTLIFGAIGLGTGGYNWFKNGSPLAESPKTAQPK